MVVKPAMMSGWMQASPPPASTTSASPRRISSAASMTACAPVEQAEMGAMLWPRRSSSWAIAPLATSGRHCGRNQGATRSQPRSRMISCCSIIVWNPPIAVPKSTPKRDGSSTTSAASSAAAFAAASASRTLRSMRRASLAPATATGSKPLTSPATRTGMSLASNCVISATPERPASSASQASSVESPTGDTLPMPVIAMRCMLGAILAGAGAMPRRIRPSRVQLSLGA